MDKGLMEINQILAHYTEDIDKSLNDALESTANDAVDKLKATSPVKPGKGGGKYRRGWKVKKKNGNYEIYNTQYQLTHLLENGHDIVAWGRKTGHFNGKKHIKPVSDWVQEEAVKRVEDNLK